MLWQDQKNNLTVFLINESVFLFSRRTACSQDELNDDDDDHDNKEEETSSFVDL